MQATANNNRKDNQSEYVTRKVYRDGQETIIVERVQKPVRLNGFEL